MDLAAALARWLVLPERGPAPAAVAGAMEDARDAGRLGDVADAHGLLALWHFRGKQGISAMPPALAARASDAYYLNLARAEHYYRELSLILKAAGELGVPVVVLKGAHVAASLYPHIATRPMVDLDLLVPRASVNGLIASLGSIGITELNRDPRVGMTHRYEIQTLLVRQGAQPYSRIALHWDLFDFPYYEGKLPVEAIFARAVECLLPGVRARVMADEELLLYLTAHAALHHQFSRLLWLADIALLLRARSTSLDWGLVAQRMRAGALTLPCREALRRVCDVFALKLPDAAQAALDAVPVHSRERAAWNEMSLLGRGAGRRFLADLGATEGARKRLAFAAAQLAPTAAYMRSRYGLTRTRDLPLAYLRRWWRGAATLGRSRRA